MTESLYCCDLTDAEWYLIEHLLPEPADDCPQGPSLRLVINGIMFLIRSGLKLRTASPWSIAECYYCRWQADRTWEKIMAALQVARAGTGLPVRPEPIASEMFCKSGG